MLAIFFVGGMAAYIYFTKNKRKNLLGTPIHYEVENLIKRHGLIR